MDANYRLADNLDWERLAAAFAARGRVEVADLLAPGQAAALAAHLRARTDWHLVLNAGDKVYELSRAGFADLSDVQRCELERRVVAAGRTGFQYRYEAIRVPDAAAERGDDPLSRFVAFLSAAPIREALGKMMQIDDIAFADGQATRYDHGHFLTRHDDAVAGKNRRAAYVFSLTPAWRPEWGGLLMFHGADGNIEEAFAPQIGALRLFRVPQLHSVSYVTPFAAEPRLSVTGWLRAAD